MIKIDCKAYAEQILNRVAEKKPEKALAIISVGENPASEAYVRGKKKDCDKCGIKYVHIALPAEAPFKNIKDYIMDLNATSFVGGIILQLPLPREYFTELEEQELTNAICSEKDVDGFRPDSNFLPCTPEGILYLLYKELGSIEGKRILVIGRGKLVGKPLAKLLLERNATVTVAHSHSDIDYEIQCEYDAVISATGVPKLVNGSQCNSKLIIDAGITRGPDGKLCGDVDLSDGTRYECARVTTVPGGVGLMTRAVLMSHMG